MAVLHTNLLEKKITSGAVCSFLMLFTNKTVIFPTTTVTSLGTYVLDSKLQSRFNSTPYGAMWTSVLFYCFKTENILQQVGFILWCVLGLEHILSNGFEPLSFSSTYFQTST